MSALTWPFRTRVVASTRREPTPHTGWCAQDHRCGVNEHRSASITATHLGGRAVITRIRTGSTEYAEVRARIPLHHTDTGARWQVAETLRLMRELLAEVAMRQGVLRSRAERRAIEGREAQR